MDTGEVNKIVARSIVEVLALKSMSQVELSRRTGIPYPTLKRIIKGTARLTLPLVASVAESLDVPVSRLLPPGLGGSLASGTDSSARPNSAS